MLNLQVGNFLSLKQIERRDRVMQLRCTGLSEVQIATTIGVSERTIRRDLNSSQARDFSEEILRRQLRDIESCKDIKLRLKYRDKILKMFSKMIVKQKIVDEPKFILARS